MINRYLTRYKVRVFPLFLRTFSGSIFKNNRRHNFKFFLPKFLEKILQSLQNCIISSEIFFYKI